MLIQLDTDGQATNTPNSERVLPGNVRASSVPRFLRSILRFTSPSDEQKNPLPASL